jgi:hypothetical protein
MDFFVITPHRYDIMFEEKKSIVEQISSVYYIKAFYASVTTPDGTFDMEKTMELFEYVDFFIADLSYERPSCYFEVGVAQLTEKTVHLMAVSGTDIHQVFNRNQVRFYRDLDEYKDLIHGFLTLHQATA